MIARRKAGYASKIGGKEGEEATACSLLQIWTRDWRIGFGVEERE